MSMFIKILHMILMPAITVYRMAACRCIYCNAKGDGLGVFKHRIGCGGEHLDGAAP